MSTHLCVVLQPKNEGRSLGIGVQDQSPTASWMSEAKTYYIIRRVVSDAIRF